VDAHPKAVEAGVVEVEPGVAEARTSAYCGVKGIGTRLALKLFQWIGRVLDRAA
jgi:hypothetical protein